MMFLKTKDIFQSFVVHHMKLIMKSNNNKFRTFYHFKNYYHCISLPKHWRHIQNYYSVHCFIWTWCFTLKERT